MTNAVVSLLYNVNYLPGALVLGISLRKLLQLSDDQTTLALLIDKSAFDDYQLQLLNELYDELIEIDPLRSLLSDKLKHDLGRPELDKTFTKIQLWSLFDRFDKVLYLDVDTLPNIPDPASSHQGIVLDLLKLEFPNHKILAAPDSGFPDIFNSGVFALKPNLNDYANLLALVQSQDKDISFDGADQGLLNQYFNAQPDWVVDLLQVGGSDVSTANITKSSNWVPIPFMYNTTPSAQYEYLPAYKYFAQRLTPSVEEGPGIDGAQSQNKNITKNFSSELAPTHDTLNRYHSAAISYYDGPNTQIKLLHFIGPVKPWFSTTKVGIFTNWWKLWDTTFEGKSIEEVIFSKPESVAPQLSKRIVTEPLSNDLDEAELETVQNKSLQEEQKQGPQNVRAPFVPPYVTDPVDLCDPKNYQHIPDIAPSGADSTWDATKEPPPRAIPMDPHPAPPATVEKLPMVPEPEMVPVETKSPDFVDAVPQEEYSRHDQKNFTDGFTSFVNVWDQEDEEKVYIEPKTPKPIFSQPDAQPDITSYFESRTTEPTAQTSEPVFYSPNLQQQLTAEVSHLGSDVGYFKSQKAERVFDDESEYIPTHLLMPLLKPCGETLDTRPEIESVANPIDSLNKDVISFNKVNEELEKLGIEEKLHSSEEVEDEDQFVDPELQYVPKLFPWEFQRGNKPERVFY